MGCLNYPNAHSQRRLGSLSLMTSGRPNGDLHLRNLLVGRAPTAVGVYCALLWRIPVRPNIGGLARVPNMADRQLGTKWMYETQLLLHRGRIFPVEWQRCDGFGRVPVQISAH